MDQVQSAKACSSPSHRCMVARRAFGKRSTDAVHMKAFAHSTLSGWRSLRILESLRERTGWPPRELPAAQVFVRGVRVMCERGMRDAGRRGCSCATMLTCRRVVCASALSCSGRNTRTLALRCAQRSLDAEPAASL